MVGKECEMSNDSFMRPGGNGDERKPAILPESSRAAAAQRLSDRPLPATRGVSYMAPQRRAHAPGWHTRRYLMRKHLHRSNLHEAAMERISTQLTLLPMAIIALIIVLVMSGILVGAM